MIPPQKIREEIADRMVRIVAPTITLGMLLITVIILLLGSNQYLRLIPASMTMIAMIPIYLITLKGRPLLGAKILLGFVSIAIIIGMYLNGGARAPAYLATLSFVSIITIVYSARGGFFYGLGTVGLGLLFIYLEKLGITRPADPAPLIYIVMILGVCLFGQIVFISIPIKMLNAALNKSSTQGQELEKAIQERKNAQQFLRSVLDTTPDIILRLTSQGNITFINNAVSRYGFSSDSFLEKNIFDYIHPGDYQKLEQILIPPVDGSRHTRTAELRFSGQSPDSAASDKTNLPRKWSTFLVEIEDIYLKDPQGLDIPNGVQGIARDISRSKINEAQLSRLAVVVEQAVDAVAITDTKGIIKYVNPKFESDMGYSQDEIIRKPINILASEKHDREFFTQMWQDIKGGKVWSGKVWNKKKDNTLILHDVSISPVLDADNKIVEFATIHRDITEQQNLEDRLRQSQKMEAIGTLAGGVAHDFNNILGAILGYADLALHDLKDDHPANPSVQQIMQAGQRAKELVRQILLFSRRTDQEMTPVRLSLIVQEVAKLLEATLPAGISIKLDLTAPRAMVMADPGQMHQILMNLCTNASHAIGNSKGRITIRLESFSIKNQDLQQFPELTSGNFIKLQVIDTGHGIPQEIIDNIFDPFFTTKSRDEGTGLGLSVVHGILENHHGTIRVSSELGKGTQFDLFLPLLESDDHYPVQILPSTDRKEAHILFVDDEKALVDVGKKSLQRNGYKVTVAVNGREAWELFSAEPDRFDLVVTDKAMPEMNGIELARRIREKQPDTPVILCTGFSESITEEQARTIGIQKILNKPVISSELICAIEEVVKL
jgi:PAS domain S-box-containing protein